MEIFPLVDEKGDVIGQASRAKCHDGSKLLHPVVHLHVLNSKGELYLQLRPAHKDIQPGKWDTSVGGHIDFGEKVEEALLREVREELGMTDFMPVFIHSYIFESEVEREMVYSYYTVYDGEINPDPTELADGRFWPLSEINRQLGNSVFTPNFEQEYKQISAVLEKINL